MPLDATFMNESRYITAEEYEEIVAELCSFGLEEIRLTGGEPLMRRSFAQITEKLAKLPLKRIGLTTNAVMLHHHFDTLKAHRVYHLNISLDSLDEARFREITHGNHLTQVMKNIETALALGFSVKLNAVAMRGINDQEVFEFLELSKRLGVEIRFLELMRIGFACENQKSQFISADELINKIQTRYKLKPRGAQADSTSFNFDTECGARVGFIASESRAFCGQCSRWRLSADGILRACLLKDDGLSIRGVAATEREAIYHTLLGMKPAMRPAEVLHQMNTIGG
jgi:cyclic pyranopterin phosphate synthase